MNTMWPRLLLCGVLSTAAAAQNAAPPPDPPPAPAACAQQAEPAQQAAPAQQPAPSVDDPRAARALRENLSEEQRKALLLNTSTLAALRQQLVRLLAEAGLPDPAQRQAVAQRLDALAKQSAALANTLPQGDARLEARHIELNTYNALAQQADAQADPKEAGFRVGQLRSAALNTRQLAAPGAGALGDFWLLQADLIDINRATDDVNQRQRNAIDRLETFLAKQPASGTANRALRRRALADSAELADPAARMMTLDVELALLRLYDQQGLSDRAAALVRRIKASPDVDAPLRRHLDESYGYTAMLGRQFAANLELSAPASGAADGDKASTPTKPPIDPAAKPATQPAAQPAPAAAGATPSDAAASRWWFSDEHRGQVVLIHFWADWYPPSTQANTALGAAYAQLKAKGFSILSVQMTDPRQVDGERLAEAERVESKNWAYPKASRSLGVADPKALTGQVAGTTVADVVGNASGASNAAALPWAVYRQGPGQVSLSRMFAVRSLPRYVLLDQQGRVAAVGGSLAILDQARRLLGAPESVASDVENATNNPANAANAANAAEAAPTDAAPPPNQAPDQRPR